MQKERLGRLGVWTWLDALSTPEASAFAREVERWGYGTLWVPEAVGREPFALLARLAAETGDLVLATGIANIYARDPMTMRAAQQTLAEASEGRFVLGLGVSHAPMVQGVRGHAYGKPVSTMRSYVEAMHASPYAGPMPGDEAPILLAALRPKMLELSHEIARGAHPYFVTPEHTARARKILGGDAWLCPEQMVLRETDPSKAREIARKNVGIYLALPNYRNNLAWLGFDESDWAKGGSDALVDAIVAWGDEDAIRERIQAHWNAGADHVCIQPFRPDGGPGPDTVLLQALAPAGGETK